MALAKTLLWVIGLLLEVVLLGVLARQHAARRLALFYALLVFYVFRSLVLSPGARWLGRGSYAMLFNALSLVDFALQVALVISLFVALRRGIGARESDRSSSPWLALPLGVLLACSLTVIAIHALPAHSPVPADRATLLTALLYVELGLWASMRACPAPEWTLSAGFAALGGITIFSQWGKSVTAFQHRPGPFLFWAYLEAVAWILVLLFWIMRFGGWPASGSRHNRG